MNEELTPELLILIEKYATTIGKDGVGSANALVMLDRNSNNSKFLELAKVLDELEGDFVAERK